MKKLIALMLAMLMVFGMAACNNTETPETTTEEPETFVTSTLVQGGASDYVIVHDGTSPAETLAVEVQKAMYSAFGVKLEVASAKDRAEDGCEIVVGNARPIAEKTINKMTGLYDFALKVEENKLVLCATNELSYEFFDQYLRREVFVKSDSADFVLDSDDNIIYSASALNETTYVDYIRSGDKKVTVDDIFTFEKYEHSSGTLPYRMYIPSNYSPDKTYPLIVALHGAGHRGNDNVQHLNTLNTLFQLEDVPVDDAIIIAPQCPEGEQWVNADWSQGSYVLEMVGQTNPMKAVLGLISEMQLKYSVDASRIYACGFSMGGYGVWNMLMNNPKLFAAGIAMCGAGDPSKARTLADIPIWAVHGDKDPTVPVAGSQEMVNAIKNAGGTKINYTELADTEHDVWTYTYGNAEIINWLFEQKKA